MPHQTGIVLFENSLNGREDDGGVSPIHEMAIHGGARLFYFASIARSLRTAAGIASAEVLPKPKTKPCRGAWPR